MKINAPPGIIADTPTSKFSISWANFSSLSAKAGKNFFQLRCHLVEDCANSPTRSSLLTAKARSNFLAAISLAASLSRSSGSVTHLAVITPAIVDSSSATTQSKILGRVFLLISAMKWDSETAIAISHFQP